ncbi:MAG: HTH domain-containing protein [Oscillospiraceae bacterium]|nr:HTH domain-containing protein [Oscillospiraceae bacterium]
MDAAQRRNRILEALRLSRIPLSAAALAAELGVSRQVIVGDVALLRAAGESIAATPRGYIMNGGREIVHTLACVHGVEDTEKELLIMVDNGCTVLDVTVDHPVYGELTGNLMLSNRYEVSQFMAKLLSGETRPLSALTDGVHLHKLLCPDEAAFLRTEAALRAEGLLYECQ